MNDKYRQLDLLYKKFAGCPASSAYARKFKHEIDEILLSLSEEDRQNYFKYKNQKKRKTVSKKKKKDCRAVWMRKCPKPYELKANVERMSDRINSEIKTKEIKIKAAGIFRLETDLAKDEISCCQHPGCKATATINGYCEFHNKYQNTESK